MNIQKRKQSFIGGKKVAQTIQITFYLLFTLFLFYNVYDSFYEMNENIITINKKYNVDILNNIKAYDKEIKAVMNEYMDEILAAIILIYIMIVSSILTFLKPLAGIYIGIPIHMLFISVPGYLFQTMLLKTTGVLVILIGVFFILRAIPAIKKLRKINLQEWETSH